uniref:ATP synthase subunit a n=1 Tax=Ophiopholis japonica TaxID=861513 RepID=A0A6C0FN35_9ECHI|nr:ATP synthase F0 subunit 6 [Ophiopholis japonica]QHT54225.1 ATP synthase F0 subunit 6 [Ophiopholis japonica]
MTLINNIFDQFNPAFLGPLSLTALGACLAVSWTAYLTTTHWTPTRNSVLKNSINTVLSNLLPQSMKTSWSQILAPVFIVCLSYNLISLIPYTFSQTSHLSVTFSLSIPLWVGINLMGIWHNWQGKISHLVPQGTPSALIPLMVMIELMSLCIQPLTLGFRLGANLLAGHLLIFLCSCVVWEAVNTSPLGIISLLLLITLFVLEIAVACIQAAVFTVLAKNYFEENFS